MKRAAKKAKGDQGQWLIEPIGPWANDKLGEFINQLVNFLGEATGFRGDDGCPHNGYAIPKTSIRQAEQAKKDLGIQFELWYRHDVATVATKRKPGAR